MKPHVQSLRRAGRGQHYDHFHAGQLWRHPALRLGSSPGPRKSPGCRLGEKATRSIRTQKGELHGPFFWLSRDKKTGKTAVVGDRSHRKERPKCTLQMPQGLVSHGWCLWLCRRLRAADLSCPAPQAEDTELFSFVLRTKPRRRTPQS